MTIYQSSSNQSSHSGNTSLIARPRCKDFTKMCDSCCAHPESRGVVDGTVAPPCTDFRQMCDYCWEQFESGNDQGASIGPCTKLDTMCDYCWRAYEHGKPNQGLIDSSDPCLQPATMCDTCRKYFNKYKNHTPEKVLLVKPGTYPVKFRRSLESITVGSNYAKEIAHTISKRLAQKYGRRVPVHAFAVTRDGGECPPGAWLLIDFPEVVTLDKKMVHLLFHDLPGGKGCWAAKIPSPTKCVGAFRLAWFERQGHYRKGY
ncbi:hypothetical protein BDW62DRAFT_197264 [Aspergillus aurantiobrunneus]